MSIKTIKPNYKNDFNYPSLSRKDLMYLDIIRYIDCPIKKIKGINSNRDWSINLYNLDIEKSSPNRSDIYINKIDFINKIDDIELARPKKEKILIKPNFILNVRDIEKAYPKKKNFVSQRHVNPLNPVYKLPSCQMAPPVTPPKFIRNQIDISDIEKARPNKVFPMKMRPPKNYDDIEGNHPKKPYVRRVFYDSFNYNDVYKKLKKFRNTNPLDPEYGIQYGGYIDGSKPCLPFYDFNIDNRFNSLSNADIYGSQPGSKNYYYNFRYDNKERFDPNDIPGASADSKKYGITTERCTNPLYPEYQYIGQSEIFDCFGDIVDHEKTLKNDKPKKKIYRNMSNPSLEAFENYENSLNNNFIKNTFNYNNTNNLSYSQDYHNIERIDRSNRKMCKSLSQCDMGRKITTLNNDNNNYIGNDINKVDNELRLYNQKLSFNHDYYGKLKQNFLKNHDKTLFLSNINKNNRLDEKMKQNGKLNQFRINKNYIKHMNIDVAKNGYDEIHQKNNLHKNRSYEERLDTIIYKK